VKLTTHLDLMSRLVELFLNSPIRLHGMVLNCEAQGQLYLFTTILDFITLMIFAESTNYGAPDFVIFSSFQRSITRPLYLRLPRICGPLARNNPSDELDQSYRRMHCAPRHLEIIYARSRRCSTARRRAFCCRVSGDISDGLLCRFL
jgi:hypothetical protein